MKKSELRHIIREELLKESAHPDSMIGRLKPQPGQVIPDPRVRAFAKPMTEVATDEQKLYHKYMALQDKVHSLEDEQKQLTEPYVRARNDNNKARMAKAVSALKANQRHLDAYRKLLHAANDEYMDGIAEIDKNIELDPKAFE